MGAVAVAVHEPADRPGWLEKILVLGVCVGLLAFVHVADQRGRERNERRAQQVMSERAERSGERASREAMSAPAARTERLGSPIMIPAGGAMGPATSVVSQRRPERPTAATTVATASRGDVDTTLLLLLAGVGLSMCGAGLRLLSRRSA